VSEQFTYVNMTPEELSSKGSGGNRQMYNYVAATQDTGYIQTPPDNYKPDKLGDGLTIEQLQQQRNTELPTNQAPQVQYKKM